MMLKATSTPRLRALSNHMIPAPPTPHRVARACCFSSTWRAPTSDDVAKYNDEGFLIVKGVLNPEEVDLVTEAMLRSEAIVSILTLPEPHW